jgi:hypothetical protein
MWLPQGSAPAWRDTLRHLKLLLRLAGLILLGLEVRSVLEIAIRNRGSRLRRTGAIVRCDSGVARLGRGAVLLSGLAQRRKNQIHAQK